MNRREVITLIGGAAAPPLLWPLAARAQQPAMPVRRLGVLLSTSETDPEGQARVAALRQGLQDLGWSEGRNLKIDHRWTGGDDARARTYAAELVASQPDVIFAAPSAALAAVQRATRTIPIVFAQISDPVGAGFVAGLAHPGGNITGFGLFEFAIGAKWLELLKQIAPSVTRVAAIYDPATPSAYGFLPMIEAAGRSFGVDVFIHAVHDTTEIERVINAFAAEPNGGLIPVASALIAVQRDFVIALANRHRLPNVYTFRYYPASGGLASYGVDNIDLYKRAASYIDRILKVRSPRICRFNWPINISWSST
jgi:putative tryptophan/tyrosine transport system substrate-binding protein